jgi:hypothetical protein
MAVESDFRNWLKANQAINAVVGTRVYPTFLPQNLPGINPDRWQAITMPVTGENNETDQEGNVLANGMSFSIRCHAYHTIEEVCYTDALALVEVIKAQVAGTLVFASYQVMATCGSRQDQPLAEMEGKSGFIQTIAVDVELVW